MRKTPTKRQSLHFECNQVNYLIKQQKQNKSLEEYGRIHTYHSQCQDKMENYSPYREPGKYDTSGEKEINGE